jgi:hypothetical protein
MKSRRTMIAVTASSLVGALALTACGGNSAERPSALASSGELKPDKSIGGAWIYRNPQANFAKYRSVLFEDVVIYNGAEANFGDASAADQQRYAQLVGGEMRRVVAEKYPFASGPGPDVLRIHTTLIGVRGTVGGVATVTRVLPVGMAINAVRGAAGAGGTMTGGIELAVEFYDSQSNELLAGAVRQVTPAAFDIEATLSTDKTVESCGAAAGMALRDAMDRNMGR